MTHRLTITIFLILFNTWCLCTETGYDLWLRYQPIENDEVASSYRDFITSYYVENHSATSEIIQKEISGAIEGMLGKSLTSAENPEGASIQIVLAGNVPKDNIDASEIENDGFIIKTINETVVITSHTETGLLYGTFHFIKALQTHEDISALHVVSNPAFDLRILNHWDNLDRTSERGYAGFSIWDWHRLPDYLDPRYTDYARANASIGVNGTVLTNVNANALVLTPSYLEKVKAIADLFRPYGIKVYLTARFSAPIEIGGLETADPLNDQVKAWWKNKVDEIYKEIPDFGGFLVKANSEGQPGPQNYGRSHADGANMMADALAPYNGAVIWRAFVYSDEEPVDRAKQAYNEFVPLDGSFKDNVLVQVKNGPIDFQPREPFHPLFGAMPETPLVMEFQITQEYLGQATQLVYLAPMFEEALDTDTYSHGKGSTVAKIIDGEIHDYDVTGIAGVANIGTDINWTGHPIAQSNWYAFGRLAWDPYLDSEDIASDWTKMTFGNEEEVVNTIIRIMMSSWEASVSYMTPLGLHHLMGTGHHYGPAPWVDNLSRADWTPYYYHKSDDEGIGFDRTKTGSNAVEQYSKELEKKYGDINKVPEELLLWFHHVPWDHKMNSGRTLWNELGYKYQEGINQVREMQKQWDSLEGKIDELRFRQVKMLLNIQEKEAIWWKDACMLYFQTYSKMDWPEMLEEPVNTLEYYKSLRFPYAPGIQPRW